MIDKKKQQIDDEWVGQKAVELLEKALEATEPDLAACTKLMEVISKVLLPKTGAKESKSDPMIDKLRKKAMAELHRKAGTGT